MSKKQTFEQALTQAFKDMFGDAGIKIETVAIPPGSTIEEEIAKREDPNWCNECKEVHDPKDQTLQARFAKNQEKALKSIDQRINDLTEAVALFKKLRDSIALPEDQRGNFTTLEEILITKRIAQLV